MTRQEELSDEQWTIIAPLIPEPPRREDGRGRPYSVEVLFIRWFLLTGQVFIRRVVKDRTEFENRLVDKLVSSEIRL
jgi:transposase